MVAQTRKFRNLDLGSPDGVGGTWEVFPSTALKGSVRFNATAQTGDTVTTITNAAAGQAMTITLPDPGASASFVMTEGAQTVNGTKTFGSAPAFPAGGFSIGGTAVASTAAEIDATCDVSARLIAAGSTLTLTVAAHSNKTILLDTASGSIVTLPAATGTGAKFFFKIKVVATTNSHIVKVANSSDNMAGLCFTLSDDATNVPKAFATTATDDTITLNRSTTGSIIRGEYIEVEDIATNLFAVRVFTQSSGTEATPFSNTV